MFREGIRLSLEQSLRKDIESIKPKIKPKILLVGPLAAGKSSYINSILTVAKGHKTDIAPTEYGGENCTRYYDKYTDDTLLKHFSFRDCMGLGLSSRDKEGINLEDIEYLLRGQIRDRYEFKPEAISRSDKDFFREVPKSVDKIYCVVFVVDSTKIQSFSPVLVWKMRELLRTVKALRIARVLLLTKIDELCPLVQNDNANMFRSSFVRNAVREAHELFNIPEASIHPVTNYEKPFQPTLKMNIPLLFALRQMMQYANDTVDEFESHSDSD